MNAYKCQLKLSFFVYRKLQKLNDGIEDDRISFEVFMLYQRELQQQNWRELFGFEPTFDSYACFYIVQNSKACKQYVELFRKNVTFDKYIAYKKAKNSTDWSRVQCTIPDFDNYVNYMIEVDRVNFDWVDVIGRKPRFEEYMAYVDTVKDCDDETRKLFSFRSVLEQGLSGGEPRPERCVLSLCECLYFLTTCVSKGLFLLPNC